MSGPEALIPRIESRLGGLGFTKDQTDWLVRALHPAMPSRAVQRAPTGGSRMTALVTYVREVDYAAPTAAAYDLLIYSSNSDTCAALVARRAVGTTWTGFDTASQRPYQPANTSLQSVIRNTDLVAVNSSFGTVSVTERLAGVLQTGQIALMFATQGWASDTRAVAWRRISSSITAYNTSSALSDGGTVVAGTFVPTVVGNPTVAYTWPRTTSATSTQTLLSISGDAWGGLTAVPSFYSAAASATYLVPMEAQDMIEMNPGCLVGPARDGAYVPTKLTDFDFVQPDGAAVLAYHGINASAAADSLWNSPTAITPTVGLAQLARGSVGMNTGVLSDLRMTDQVFTSNQLGVVGYSSGTSTQSSIAASAKTLTFSVAAAAQQEAIKAFPVYGTGLDRSQTSVILFNNLPAAATIRVKTVCVYELAVDPYSPLTAIMGPPAEPCDGAIAAYFKLAYEMPQAVVAAENGLGTLLYGLWDLVKAGAAPMGRILARFGDDMLSKHIPQPAPRIAAPSREAETSAVLFHPKTKPVHAPPAPKGPSRSRAPAKSQKKARPAEPRSQRRR